MKYIILCLGIAITLTTNSFASAKKIDRKPNSQHISISTKCFETAQRIAMTIFQEGYGYGGMPNSQMLSPNGDFQFSFEIAGSKQGDTYKMQFAMDPKSEACTLRSLSVL